MRLKIIYEDDDVIVIDKPAGIAVHSAIPPLYPKNKVNNILTIVRILLKYYPEIRGVGENPLRPGIVHRLDKETSGLMAIAKNNEAFFELKKQFQERRVEKKYTALVSGALAKDEGVIKISLVKIGTKTTTRNKGGADPPLGAITEYKVLQRYNDYTLVEVIPKTGRQHQIRVHFASINHPVACDKLYGRKSKKCPPGLNRHFLHATLLKFRLKSALMEFESALPEDLKQALKKING